MGNSRIFGIIIAHDLYGFFSLWLTPLQRRFYEYFTMNPDTAGRFAGQGQITQGSFVSVDKITDVIGGRMRRALLRP
jgi:hypothetical protein